MASVTHADYARARAHARCLLAWKRWLAAAAAPLNPPNASLRGGRRRALFVFVLVAADYRRARALEFVGSAHLRFGSASSSSARNFYESGASKVHTIAVGAGRSARGERWSEGVK